jgi:diguanylate cyclase (GGDEF)-like protein
MSGSTRNVLIVEDDPEIGYLITAVLEDDDRSLHLATTGAEAEQLASEIGIDLILLDLILPDVDGRQLLKRFRERPATSAVPVIVVSARGGADIRNDCYALGADVFYSKPFDPEQLQQDVRDRLGRDTGARQSDLIDPLTGLWNRAGLHSQFGEVEEASALALVQLDGFFKINERWGWQFGEGVLQTVTGALPPMPEGTTLSRLGAADFALFRPGGDLIGMTNAAEALLDALRDVSVDEPGGETFRVTASIGVTEVAEGKSLDEALDDARLRLFRAQAAGHNQVVSDDVVSESTVARILVAEDDPISATILRHRLEKEGLEVTHMFNGREAYERAIDETPDLVILDVKMPGMDGFEVLERLRRVQAFSTVPIIMLTSMGSEADVVRGFQLGADDYVLKPFSPIELSARVQRLLRRGRAEESL